MGSVRSETVEANLTANYEQADGVDADAITGIFSSWDKHTIDSLNKWEEDGVTSLKDKQLHMVAHMLELGYDLMLATDWNVSTMPGFEKFGLINLKRKRVTQ